MILKKGYNICPYCEGITKRKFETITKEIELDCQYCKGEGQIDWVKEIIPIDLIVSDIPTEGCIEGQYIYRSKLKTHYTFDGTNWILSKGKP